LSHRSAAWLWGILESTRSAIDVTVVGRHRHGHHGVDVHRVRSLHPNDRTTNDGIPVTAVARTLLDLAEVVPFRRLAAAFEQAERLGILDLHLLQSLYGRSRGRAGLKLLGRLLSETREPPDVRSVLERRFVDLCREFGLPEPMLNATLEGFTVDAAWPRHGLVVELDGFAYHRTRAAFERDRVRDEVLQRAGYRVVRITYRRLDREPVAVADAIRSLLQGMK
jgi:hypothetical protein